MSNISHGRHRTLALWLLCLGVLMIILDSTIITVALPSMLIDLGLSSGSASWIVNAYMLPFGGFMLLSGRLGDLYGRRRVFLVGLCAFTLASLLGGFVRSEAALIAARTVQGLGGAAITGIALSLITSLFPEPAERARAMGLYGSICAAGGGIGELFGGVITNALNWHWIFLVNVPIGVAIYAASSVVLPRDTPPVGSRPGLDVPGAFAITVALTLLVYALSGGNDAGWASAEIQASLAAAGILLLLFLWIETHAREPLVPLGLFRVRYFVLANTLVVLSAAATFAWFVIAALYLQRVLGYNPLRVGLAFVPTELVMAAFSVGLAAKMVTRFGLRGPLSLGLLLSAVGLALFSRVPASGTFVADVLPGMIIMGLGAGMTSTPLMLAAMRDVGSERAGLASGLLNTFYSVGGALGLAVLSSLADARANELQLSGTVTAALSEGYQRSFLIASLLTGMAAGLGALVFRPEASPITDPSVGELGVREVKRC